MLLLLLGILDMIAGIILGLSGFVTFNESSFVLYLGIIMIVKGIVSYLTGAAKGFYMDFMGILDIIGGMLMILAATGFVLFFFPYIGLLLLLKGAYSMLIGIPRK